MNKLESPFKKENETSTILIEEQRLEGNIINVLPVQLINKSKHVNPTYSTNGSAGMDIRANINEVIILNPSERIAVPTGIHIGLPLGYEAQIRPRSGLAIKNGIGVLNSPGTVDADFRGEIKVILINHSNESFIINDGDRIAQMVVAKHETVSWNVVENLDETDRGSNGFGSSGVK